MEDRPLLSKVRSPLHPSHLSPGIFEKFLPAMRTLFTLHYQFSHLRWIILISIQRTFSFVHLKNLNILLSTTPFTTPFTAKFLEKVVYSLCLSCITSHFFLILFQKAGFLPSSTELAH